MVVTAGEEGGGVVLASGRQRLRMFPRMAVSRTFLAAQNDPRCL